MKPGDDDETVGRAAPSRRPKRLRARRRRRPKRRPVRRREDCASRSISARPRPASGSRPRPRGRALASAEELRKQGKDQPARLAEQAADRGDQLGSYLSEADADRILRDVEDFGRRSRGPSWPAAWRWASSGRGS